MNVFIIATSHNIIQVREAIKFYKLDKKDVLLIYMHFCKEEPAFDLIPDGIRCEFFNIWSLKEVITHRKDYRLYSDFLKQLKRQHEHFIVYSNFYTSDYVLVANSILKPERIVVMDEGAASIGVVIRRRADKRHVLKHFVKSILYIRKIEIPQKITYFTQYPLNVDEPDTIDMFVFDKEKNEIISDSSYAIVLGQPLSEMNIIEEAYYVGLMTNLGRKLNSDGINRIDYYAHRREMPVKLEHIKKLGWSVHGNNNPFETVFPTLNPSPIRIYSFYSPILDTLSKKYENIPEFYVIEIPKEKYSGNGYAVTQEVYTVFKKNSRLKVITINTSDDV